MYIISNVSLGYGGTMLDGLNINDSYALRTDDNTNRFLTVLLSSF